MFSVPVLLRLSLLPGRPNPHLQELLTRSLSRLQLLEGYISPPRTGKLPISRLHDRHPTRPTAPHQSQHLFDIPEYHDLFAWGRSVEALWRVSMNVEARSAKWDELTARLLIWRCIVGDEHSSAGEWARRQVVSMLRQP